MVDPDVLMAEAMTEAELQRNVLECATVNGFLTYHTFDSRRSNPGFPDLTLIRGGRLILAELKRETGRLQPEQLHWLAELEQVRGIEVYVWRPMDWRSGEIERILARTPVVEPDRVLDPADLPLVTLACPRCGRSVARYMSPVGYVAVTCKRCKTLVVLTTET